MQYQGCAIALSIRNLVTASRRGVGSVELRYRGRRLPMRRLAFRSSPNEMEPWMKPKIHAQRLEVAQYSM